MEDTSTPFAAQVVVMLSFRYGDTADERYDSFIYARVNAFSSRACLNKSFEPVPVGTPVVGLLDITKSDYKSAQLIGCLGSEFRKRLLPPPVF